MSSTMFLRTASSGQSRSVHSGHSLTDSYIHAGAWPGDTIAIAESIGIRRASNNIVKSTIPGSPLRWRWSNPVADLRPGDPTADARLNIADFDTLVITEGGPPPRVGKQSDSLAMTETLDYLCRFTANAIENGDGGQGALDVVVWSIWPSLTMWRPERPNYTTSWQEFADFRSALPEYGKSFQFMAEFTSWKMREIYPSLPADWRVWLFPGHLWMARVWDDIEEGKFPSLTSMQDLFKDDIHPNKVGEYGLACLMVTCLYQVNLNRARRLHTPAGVSATVREYFSSLAWDIATTYAAVGMNGHLNTASVWDATIMEDPLPNWTPRMLIK